ALRRLDAPQRPETFLLVPARDSSARDLYVLAGQGILDLRNAQTVPGEAVGIHEDLDLAPLAAHDGDGPHVLDGLELTLDPLVGNLGDLARRALAGDHHRHDRGRIGVGLFDDGRLGAGREAGDDGVDL